MSSRSVITHLLLAVGGLGLAFYFYVRSKGGAATAPEGVVLLDVHKRDIKKIVLADEGKTVTLERRQGEDGEPYFWITTDNTPKTGKAEKKEAKANGDIDKNLLDMISPWKATRVLGDVAADKLAEFGISLSKKSVTITAGSTDFKVTVGENEYGTDQKYVQDGRDGKVYLVRGAPIAGLEAAGTRFFERALHKYTKADIETATVTAGDKKAEFLQKNRTELPKAFWARPASAEKKEEFVGNWLDKVLGFNALDYGTMPGDAVSVFKVIFRDARSELGSIEVLRAASADGKGTDYFARTPNSPVPVKIAPSAGDVAKEIDKIFG